MRFLNPTGVQLGVLQILAQANEPSRHFSKAKAFIQCQIRKLRNGDIPLDDLLVAKKLSRELIDYKVPSPAAQAAMQLQAKGVEPRAGMRVNFWYIYGGVKISDVKTKEVDVKRYKRLVDQAIDELSPSWELTNYGKFVQKTMFFNQRSGHLFDPPTGW